MNQNVKANVKAGKCLPRKNETKETGQNQSSFARKDFENAVASFCFVMFPLGTTETLAGATRIE